MSARYIKCPRCDLNWILEGEELCDVCKAELNLDSPISLLEDEEDSFTICPYCNVNYIEDGEEMCIQCRADHLDKEPSDEKEKWDIGESVVEDDESSVPTDIVDAWEEDDVDIEDVISSDDEKEEEEEEETEEEKPEKDDYDRDFDDMFLDDDEDSEDDIEDDLDDSDED